MSGGTLVQSGFDALRARLEKLPFAAVAWDDSLRPLACNRHAARVLKLPQAGAYLEVYDELFPVYQPDGSQSVRQLSKLLSVAMTAGLAQSEWNFKDLRSHTLLSTEITLTRAQIGENVIVLGYLTLRGDTSIRETDERLRVMMEVSPAGIVMWDAQGQMIESNERMKQLLAQEERGDPSENFAQMFPSFQSFAMQISAKIVAIVEQTLARGRHNGEWTYRNAAGKFFAGNLVAVRTVYHDRPVVVAFIDNIRERNAETENLSPTAAQALSTELVCHLWTPAGELLDCNAAALKLCGDLDKTEHLARFFEFFFPASAENDDAKNLSAYEVARRKIAKAVEDGCDCFVWSRRTVAGAIVPTEVTLKRLRQGDGYLVASFMRDLSLDFASQITLRRNGEFAQEIIDKMPQGCLVWNRDLRLLDCNERVLSMFGFSDKNELLVRFGEMLQTSVSEGEASAARLDRHLRDTFESGEAAAVLHCKRNDGSPLPLEIVSLRYRFQKIDVAVTYARDVQEITTMIDRLHARDELVRVLFDKMPFGAMMLDENARILHNNLPMAQLFGLSQHENFVERFMDLLPPLQPNGQESRLVIEEELSRVRERGYALREFVYQCADGSILPVELTLTRARINQTPVIACYVRDLREHQAMMATIYDNEQQLRAARDRAEAAAQSKDEFLNKISHELKTPLNGVLGLLNLLRHTPLDDKQNEYLRKADLSAQSLLRLIDDVLDLTAITRNELTMQFLEFNLPDTIRDLCAAKLPLFADKGLKLQVDADYGEYDIVVGDQLRLKQVLTHLLENAVKFTFHGGAVLRIAVKTASVSCAMFEFSVSDTGVGLSPEQIENLFKPFKQADDSLTRQYGGIGLGLAMSQKLVEMMGGEIRVESRPDCGATFKFTAIFNVAVGLRGYDKKTPSSTVKSRLLLVDDNEINQMVAEVALSEMGYECDCAKNGEEAVAKVAAAAAKNAVYDAVLMDIQMPVMDGFEATRRIRKLPNCRVPVIALSANASDDDRAKSAAAGMDDHLAKPFDPDLTVATIRKFGKKYS